MTKKASSLLHSFPSSLTLLTLVVTIHRQSILSQTAQASFPFISTTLTNRKRWERGERLKERGTKGTAGANTDRGASPLSVQAWSCRSPTAQRLLALSTAQPHGWGSDCCLCCCWDHRASLLLWSSPHKRTPMRVTTDTLSSHRRWRCTSLAWRICTTIGKIDFIVTVCDVRVNFFSFGYLRQN